MLHKNALGVSFQEEKKSSTRSTYLHGHGGRMGWGPCGENTELISHVLLILLGKTQ